MDMSSTEETRPSITNDDIPLYSRDTRRLYQKRLAVYLILASIVFECAAYYVLDTNLTRTLQYNNLHWKESHRTIALYIFEGIEFLTMLVFAILADAKLGRIKTIMIGKNI